MVQKEVAERLAAKPSSHDYGPLSVLIQYYATPKYGFTVPPGAFKPRPKVDSAVIRLNWNPDVARRSRLHRLRAKSFLSRRKKLVNNLLRNLSRLGRDEILRRMAKAGIAKTRGRKSFPWPQF